jgi:hypothetical protein
MDSVRQRLRPKHQLLILKCYPRLPKNSAADVKPNGSELSYLLYYASTRRSKLQKVGSFLERKTASDVSRSQSARLLVTLQVLTALLENKAVGAGSGFALIAPFVLRIIREILQNTNDISLIEATLATWDVFCAHQDQATLKADSEYRDLYEDVVKRYAAFAYKGRGKKLGKSTQMVAVHDAIRLREAGLGAIKSILLSDALASESGRQLNVVVPAILSNVRGEDEGYLLHLVKLSQKNEEDEKDKALARRMSIASVRTFTGLTDASGETDPRQAEGTVQDADELAEEETAVLALDCLRVVFANENRPQVRSATSAVLRYIADIYYRPQTRGTEKQQPVPSTDFAANSWATKLFEICTAWTPVQDRFILMVPAVETLVRLPLRETDLAQHLLYTHLIDHILRSNLNLIGLSIMDVLLSLIQQILRVLQLNGPRVAGRSSAVQLFSSQEELKVPASSSSSQPPVDSTPSEERMRLTARLKNCISDLGTHVYYTDQISDMISAILLRLKPNPTPTGQQNPVVTAAAIEEPNAAVAEVASNVSLPARDRSGGTSSGFFSFDTARQIALEAVRDVMLVSNSARALSTGGVADSRNKVPISIWEGTQWLLRDPAPDVRRAYVDALTTWLQLETKKADMRVKEPKDKEKKMKADGALARRAVSNASQKQKSQSRKATNSFLQLLHLAVYENALQFSAMRKSELQDPDTEILTLHFLLATFVQKLGVNAIVSGLPMVFALQEEIQYTENAVAKVRIGSLVHGYFWSIVEVFDLDISPVGRDVFAEIKKRKEDRLWVRDLIVPAKGLDSLSADVSNSDGLSKGAEDTATSTDAFNAFEQRNELVDSVATSYAATNAASPTPSAPGSPGSPGRTPGGRRLSASIERGPTLDRAPSSYLTVKQPGISAILPDKYKDAMMEIWTRDSCLAAIAAAAPKSVSLSGSRSSPSHALAAGNHRQLLAAANTGPSPVRNGSLPKNPLRLGEPGAAAVAKQNALASRLNSQSPDRRTSRSTNGPLSTSAGVRGRLRVDDLKRVLAGGSFTAGYLGRLGEHRQGDDTASESLVDIEGEDLASDSAGFMTPPQTQSEAAAVSVPAAIPEEKAPLPVWAPAGDAAGEESAALEKPPHLSLANDVFTDGKFPASVPVPEIPSTDAAAANGKPPPSRGGASVKSNRGRSKKELAALLAGIGADKSTGRDEKKFAGMGRPPY